MKKKLFGIVLCVLLLVGVLAFSASASGTIRSITFNGLNEPVPGEEMDFNVTPLFGNLYEIAENGQAIFWYDDTVGKSYSWSSADCVFIEDHDYRVRIYVELKDGNEFPADLSTVTAFIDNTDATLHTDSNGYFIQAYFDTCGTIENVDIYYDFPVAGEAPCYDKLVNYRYYSSGNASPNVNGVSWYDVTEGKYLISGTGAKFVCGHSYRLSIILRTDNCEFGNASAKVNGKTAQLSWGSPTVVSVDYTFASLADHKYEKVTTPATASADGKTETVCTVCGNVSESKTIAKIKSVTLSETNYIHDGKNKTPKVTVKDADGNKLVKNVDYKTSVASKRAGIGRYTVKVTFMGNYSGSKSVYFYIKPGKPASVKSASQTTSSVKLSWSKVSGAAGYTVYRYSPSKKSYVKAGTTEGTSLTVKKLNTGTKYTFRVVAYGKTSGGKVYDSDSYALLKTATKTATPTLSKVTTTKGKATLTHTNVSGETGYTVYYSTKKDSGFKKYANFKADTKTCNITGLTSGKTYYFKVRTYIKTDSGYVYSAWSAVKGIKVK